jgi:DUF4097 and DUF4098 domain-containing protein YvlB
LSITDKSRLALARPITIELVYYESEKDPIEVLETATGLTIENEVVWYFNWFSGLQWFTHMSDVYYELYVYLPAAILFNVNVDAVNGAIVIDSLDAFGDLTLETTNGAVTLENIDATQIRVETTNGNLNLDNLTADTLSAYTTNGQLYASNLTATVGKLSLSTTNGIIEASALTTNDLVCSTTNGNITVSVNGIYTNFATNLSTTNGLIYVDDAVVDDGHYNTTMSNEVDISTTNGVIHLNFLG